MCILNSTATEQVQKTTQYVITNIIKLSLLYGQNATILLIKLGKRILLDHVRDTELSGG